MPINSRRWRHLQSPTSPCLRLLRQLCLVQLLQKHLCQVSSYMRLRGERVRSSISKKIKRNAPKTMDKPLRNLADVFPHDKQMASRRVTWSSTFKVLFCHQASPWLSWEQISLSITSIFLELLESNVSSTLGWNYRVSQRVSAINCVIPNLKTELGESHFFLAYPEMENKTLLIVTWRNRWGISNDPERSLLKLIDIYHKNHQSFWKKKIVENGVV